MNNQNITFIFFGIFLGLWIVILLLDRKSYLLRDSSSGDSRPFSWSRVQMTWWTVIILTAFVTAIVRTRGVIPVLDNSTLYMLGISSVTTISATLIDVSDRSNPTITHFAQDMKSAGMIIDILSDKTGINIHRLQTFFFNIIFGVWFMYESLQHLFIPPACTSLVSLSDTKAFVECLTAYANSVMPVIAPNNLVLLAASSGLYAALKTTENKQPTGAVATSSPEENDDTTSESVLPQANTILG